MIDMEANTTLVQRFPAHEAVPGGEGSPFSSVVVLHDVYGLTPHVRATANRLAREGFYTLAPNLYALPFSAAAGAPAWMSSSLHAAEQVDWSGYPIATSFRRAERSEAEAQATALATEKWHEVVRNALGYLAIASDARTSSAALLGFGLGARFAFESACLWPNELKAVVCYSPPQLAVSCPLRPADRIPLLEFESLRAPALFLFGEQDVCVRDGERDAIDSILRAAGKENEIVSFREAGADFFDEDSNGYRIAAAKSAWEKTLGFLRRHLEPRAATRPDTLP